MCEGRRTNRGRSRDTFVAFLPERLDTVALPQESARPPVASTRTSFWRWSVVTSRRRTCAASPPSAGWSSSGRRVGSGNHRFRCPDEKVPGGGRILPAPDHDPTLDLPRACGRSLAGSPPGTSSSPSVPATSWRRPQVHRQDHPQSLKLDRRWGEKRSRPVKSGHRNLTPLGGV
jgi:hypothetical protein